MEAYPGGTAFDGQAVEELAEGAAAVEVEAIPGGVLADDYQFFYAVGYQVLGFGDDCLDGSRMVSAADEWDGAVGAAAVASFGDLEVGVVGGGGEGTGFYGFNGV